MGSLAGNEEVQHKAENSSQKKSPLKTILLRGVWLKAATLATNRGKKDSQGLNTNTECQAFVSGEGENTQTVGNGMEHAQSSARNVSEEHQESRRKSRTSRETPTMKVTLNSTCAFSAGRKKLPWIMEKNGFLLLSPACVQKNRPLLCGSAWWPPRNNWLTWISSSHRRAPILADHCGHKK